MSNTYVLTVTDLDVDLEEFCPKTLDLLLDCCPGVAGTDYGAHALGLPHGRQPGHAAADDEHLSWGHLTSRCDLT